MEYKEEHLAEYLPLAHALARRVEWSPDDHDDLVQEGLVALLKSMREYARPGRSVDNPQGLAQRVMLASMKWWYTPKDRTTVFCELRDDHLVSSLDREDVYLEEFFQAIYAAHGALARAVAEALVSPAGTVARLALEDAMRKAARAAQGELVRGHSTVRLTHEHVRKALNMEESQWYSVLSQVRRFTRRYLTQQSSRV